MVFLMPPSPQALNSQRSGGTPSLLFALPLLPTLKAASLNLCPPSPPRVTAPYLRSRALYWLVSIAFQLSAAPDERTENTYSESPLYTT